MALSSDYDTEEGLALCPSQNMEKFWWSAIFKVDCITDLVE